jgi:periplasmic divalent cation tolerance protein
MQPTDALVVLTTVASEDAGVALVRGLLDQRLIACGTLLPGARSLYRWQGDVADAREVVVLLKTRAPQLAALEAACAALHPYAVPELLALEVAAGNATYLDWLMTETVLARP